MCASILEDWDFTDGWWDARRLHERHLLFASFVISAVFLVSASAWYLWGTSPEDERTTDLLATIFSIAVLLLLVLPSLVWYLRRFLARSFKHFRYPFKEALAVIEGLLAESGQAFTKAGIDEAWFGGLRERAGIDRDILKYRSEGISMVILELAGGTRFVEVDDVPTKDGRVTCVAIWPVKGEHEAPIRELMASIDRALGHGPS